METIKVEKRIGQHVLSIETGVLAKQAAGSCLIRYNDTVVLVAVATGEPRAGIDFFPLTCHYRERTAAAGKFPGGFLKREGRPTTKETLTARLIDRPIRPLFRDSTWSRKFDCKLRASLRFTLYGKRSAVRFDNFSRCR